MWQRASIMIQSSVPSALPDPNLMSSLSLLMADLNTEESSNIIQENQALRYELVPFFSCFIVKILEIPLRFWKNI